MERIAFFLQDNFWKRKLKVLVVQFTARGLYTGCKNKQYCYGSPYIIKSKCPGNKDYKDISKYI